MRSTRLGPVLLAACLAAAASCSDSTTSTTTPVTQAPTVKPPTLVTLTGVIRTGGSLDQVSLDVGGGGVPLGGNETVNLRSLDGDEVEVRGTWAGITDGDDILVVSDFIVRQVGGADVLDGILTPLFIDDSGTTAVGYAIDLTGGSSVPLVDPPQDLIDHVGQRVWVKTSAEGKPEAFGVIGPPTM